MKALDSQHVVIGGTRLVAVTWDGGKSWKLPFSQSGIHWDINGLCFADSRHGFLVGGTGPDGNDALLARTSDGGLTWVSDSITGIGFINKVAFTDSLNGWFITNAALYHSTGHSGVGLQPNGNLTLNPSSFPEPFSTSTTIRYSLPIEQHVSISVFDVAGRLVTSLLAGNLQATGPHMINFDGSGLPAGVYNYAISTERYSASGRILRIK